ncbi:uncharacterized protein LOC128224107 [Mya arenaria]|uniref:uncharacterized protein LOC128224107 n=1 Tax=Mya arenaria TaxID=6604 RepID=UPI0022E12452|nr:uncharacterized protein LOC128224107 [Mya arenaria]
MSDNDRSELANQKSPVSARKAKKLLYLSEYLLKQESKNNSRKVSRILKKHEHERTVSELEHLEKHQDIVKRIRKNRERRQISEQRSQETEDSDDALQQKCEQLADILRKSKKTVIYTGAGISTAASIPDYRGPQGVWTLLKRGESIDPQDLSDAEPTLTHMCITQLHKQGHVKHVVSQNCDGLHVRSGLPRQVLSEVHGNMFIEICHSCKPHREYFRLFDTTESTGVRRHRTGRKCHKCGGELRDTIVHFGEKGGIKSPYRWKEAVKAANRSDVILCLGTSLKILKKYACLWCPEKTRHQRPKLVIVNLQWTPKDDQATIKINGRCDVVMHQVMQALEYEVPKYDRLSDPLFQIATKLSKDEIDSTSKKILEHPSTSPTPGPLDGISRTPTPSDSSRSSASSSGTESGNEELDMEEMGDSDWQGKDDADVKWHRRSRRRVNTEDDFKKSDKINGEDDDDDDDEMLSVGLVKTSAEMNLSKSERICNAAKIAMQTKLVNAKINEVYANCAAGSSTSSVDATITRIHEDIGSVDSVSKTVITGPHLPGPFDPGPASYDDKVAYLHRLKEQLNVLKEKQKVLKHQEVTEQKTKRHREVECTISPKGINHIETESSIGFVSVNQAMAYQKGMVSILPPKLLSPLLRSPEGTAHDWRYDVERIKGSIKHIQQEQRVIQEQRCLVQQEFVELDNAIKRKHQDEQMRLHQHFLLQEQHLSRAVDGASKKEGLMKLFVYQQQILLAQQNAHLIEITQKHAQQIKDLDVALARKHGELMSETKHLTECQNKLNLNSLQTHPLSPSGSGQQKSPNKTDFSITSILQQDTPVSPTSLPGVTELINTMLTCESCRFLKNYGVVKRKCQNCQQLKSRNGPILATVPGQVPNTAFRAESETASRVGSRERPKKVGRVASATVSSPDNIAYKQGTDLFKQKKVKSLHSTSIQNPLSQDNRLPISLLTAVTNEPCERTASASSKTTAVSKPVIKIQTAFAEPFQAGPKAKFSLWEDEPSEKIRNRPVTYVANNRLNIRGPKTRSKQEKVKTRTSKTAVNESHESSEQAAAHKPFRSHSHSDIYDDRQEGSNSVSPGSRQLRSHSHTVGTSASCSDLELTPSKSEDSLDSSLDGQSSGKKRKLMRCLSVPGWYGKGLNIKNIKRKRKY